MVPVLAVRKCPADPQEAEVLMAQRLVELAQDILQLKVEPEQETAQFLAESEQEIAEDCIVHSISVSAYF